MGMYNYLNGEQVKCFPVPLVYQGSKYNSEEDKQGVQFSDMGGLLLWYVTGSEVPYRTAIYNYGKDFLVFDYRGNSDDYADFYYIVHQIKDGKVFETYKLEELPKDISLNLVIDNYGNPLNIKTFDNFSEIIKDEKELISGQYYSGVKALRPMFEDYLDSVRNEEEPREDIREEYDRQLRALQDRTINKFREKWYSDKWLVSNNIGYLVGVALDGTRNEEIIGFIEQYKQESEDFAAEVAEYKKWSSGFLTADEIDKLLNIN